MCAVSMNFCFRVLIVTVIVIGAASCGKGERTADGGCYYKGKGILQVLGTVGDVAAAWARAERERLYQEQQIRLATIEEELRLLDLDDLERRYNAALMSNNRWRISSIQSEMTLWEMKVEMADDLKENIADYQKERQKELETGPSKSFSQIIDQSGNCE